MCKCSHEGGKTAEAAHTHQRDAGRWVGRGLAACGLKRKVSLDTAQVPLRMELVVGACTGQQLLNSQTTKPQPCAPVARLVGGTHHWRGVFGCHRAAAAVLQGARGMRWAGRRCISHMPR